MSGRLGATVALLLAASVYLIGLMLVFGGNVRADLLRSAVVVLPGPLLIGLVFGGWLERDAMRSTGALPGLFAGVVATAAAYAVDVMLLAALEWLASGRGGLALFFLVGGVVAAPRILLPALPFGAAAMWAFFRWRRAHAGEARLDDDPNENG